MKKSVISILSVLTGALLGGMAVGKTIGDALTKTKCMSDKHLSLFLMMNQWVRVKQEGKNLSDYLVKNGYRRIAVYGMSYAGETMVDELKDTEVTVAYGIDQRAGSLYAEVNIVSMEDSLEKVDAVIVTAITFFEEIEEQLSKKIDCPIISLEDVLYEI